MRNKLWRSEIKTIFNTTIIPHWIVVKKKTSKMLWIFVVTVWRRSASLWAAARRVNVLVWRCSAQLVVRAKCHRFSWADAGALLPPWGADGDSGQAWETFCFQDCSSPTENANAIHYWAQLGISMLFRERAWAIFKAETRPPAQYKTGRIFR